MNPGFHCTGQMADSMYGIVWVSGLLMSTLWIEWPMVAVGLWNGPAYVMDNEQVNFVIVHKHLIFKQKVVPNLNLFLLLNIKDGRLL